jgi:protein-tyrosine phosphatase
MPIVVFVCSGNICRSPMAEYLAWSTATDGDIEFASAGTAAPVGRPPSAGAILVMAELGIDISDHASTDVWEVERPVDRIYALSREHLLALRRAWPDRADQIHMLRPDGASIDDPWGGGEAVYRATRDEIAEAVDARAAEGWH